MRRTTIKDVAKKAEVSPATVSLVLNNGPGVSSVTRERVLRVVREVDYKPDSLARSFSSGRSQAITLVMPPGLDSFTDPYFMELMRGVLEAVRDRAYMMMLEIADGRFLEQRLWDDLFRRKRIDGLLVATPRLDQGYLRELAGFGYPGLLINGARPDLPELDFVGYDDVRCGMDATYYLIGLGHRRIAHITGPDNEASARGRLEGYSRTLERTRTRFRPEDVFPGDYMRGTAEAAMTTLLQRPAAERPTALFCANDTMAIAAMEVARAYGLSVPGDLSIVGVDDTGAAATAAVPLTTMRQDIHDLSRRAAARFLRKLEERTDERIFEYAPMPLIERASCAPLKGGR